MTLALKNFFPSFLWLFFGPHVVLTSAAGCVICSCMFSWSDRMSSNLTSTEILALRSSATLFIFLCDISSCLKREQG